MQRVAYPAVQYQYRQSRTIGRELVQSAMMIADVVVVSLSSLVAFLLYYVPKYGGMDLSLRYILVGLFGGFVLVQLGRINGWYNVERLSSLRNSFASLLVIWSITTLVIATLIFLLRLGDEFSRGWFISFWLIGLAVLTLSRLGIGLAIGSLQRQGTLCRRTVIIGAEDSARQLLSELEHDDLAARYDIVGIFADGGGIPADDLQSPHRITDLGWVGDPVKYIADNRIDLIIIAANERNSPRFCQLVEGLRDLPIDIWQVVRPIAPMSSARQSFDFLGTVPILAVAQTPLRNWSFLAKRTIDVGLAALLLLLLTPLLLLVGVAIKSTSPGPVLFRQQRFGFGGEPIEVLKFRSMYVDLEDSSGEQRTVRQDPRVTPVGRFIRQWSIDELPQLINVLRGEMSIVGPRAHPTAMKVGDQFYHTAVHRYAARHRMLPGITGWAQVNHCRGEIETIEQARRRIELDLHYIENWSLSLDLQILAKTMVCVCKAENAY